VTTTAETIRQGFLTAGIPQRLVDELLESFTEAKRRYYREDLRPNAVEGGRFSEAVFRLLQWASDNGRYTPIGKTLPTVDTLLATFANANCNDSIRLHLPRTLRLIYDIRNKRDAAHLGDGIDPNLQDATLVVRNMDWVLGELVRLYHNVTATDAYHIISELVSKDVPVIQLFNGFPRILRDLRASEHCIVLLYWRGPQGASLTELAAWMRPKMRRNLRRTIDGLDEKNLVHLEAARVFLTRLGEVAVESAKLIEPA
jgi:hypothetical protein